MSHDQPTIPRLRFLWKLILLEASLPWVGYILYCAFYHVQHGAFPEWPWPSHIMTVISTVMAATTARLVTVAQRRSPWGTARPMAAVTIFVGIPSQLFIGLILIFAMAIPKLPWLTFCGTGIFLALGGAFILHLVALFFCRDLLYEEVARPSDLAQFAPSPLRDPTHETPYYSASDTDAHQPHFEQRETFGQARPQYRPFWVRPTYQLRENWKSAIGDIGTVTFLYIVLIVLPCRWIFQGVWMGVTLILVTFGLNAAKRIWESTATQPTDYVLRPRPHLRIGFVSVVFATVQCLLWLWLHYALNIANLSGWSITWQTLLVVTVNWAIVYWAGRFSCAEYMFEEKQTGEKK